MFSWPIFRNSFSTATIDRRSIESRTGCFGLRNSRGPKRNFSCRNTRSAGEIRGSASHRRQSRTQRTVMPFSDGTCTSCGAAVAVYINAVHCPSTGASAQSRYPRLAAPYLPEVAIQKPLQHKKSAGLFSLAINASSSASCGICQPEGQIPRTTPLVFAARVSAPVAVV